MEHISKAQVKLVRSLQQKKYRDEHGYFVAEGDKCINELKKSFELVLLANRENATETEIAQMSALRAPQGSIAVFKQRPSLNLQIYKFTNLILCLDGVQDPGNLGTIIRTCDWFGVRHIVCSKDTADCYNPKVVQATMGALARVQVSYCDLEAWLKTQQCPIYGTLLDGKDMYEILYPLPSEGEVAEEMVLSIVVMGNEGNGISPAVRELVTHPICIPSYPKDAETSESLNVAIATAIVLAEFRRP